MRLSLTLASGVAAAFMAAVVAAPPSSAAIASNPGFGGYEVRAPSATTARMQARIVSLPTVACTEDTRNGSALLGIHLNVAAADAAVWAAIEMSCVGLTPTYTAEFSTGGAATKPSMSVSPGDKVQFLLAAGPTGENVYVTDLTTAAKAHGHSGMNFGASAWNAAYGVISVRSTTLVPRFTTPIAWSQATFDAAAIGSQSPVPSNLTRTDGSGVVLVHTTPLAAGGRFFKNTWVRSH